MIWLWLQLSDLRENIGKREGREQEAETKTGKHREDNFWTYSENQ